MKRRNAIKGLAMIPFAGTVLRNQTVQATQTAGNVSAAEALTPDSATSAFMAETNIFRSIGVEPVINCMGTFTIIGGSLERPAVRDAMEAASHNFVQYDELAAAAVAPTPGVATHASIVSVSTPVEASCSGVFFCWN